MGVVDGGGCEAENFLESGSSDTQASREGLVAILEHVAQRGLQNVPLAWVHEANKAKRIYEFRKGDLRLFFFKGNGSQIAICTGGVLKKGQKADKGAVNRAVAMKNMYVEAVQRQTIEVVND